MSKNVVLIMRQIFVERSQLDEFVNQLQRIVAAVRYDAETFYQLRTVESNQERTERSNDLRRRKNKKKENVVASQSKKTSPPEDALKSSKTTSGKPGRDSLTSPY